jgi:hypothetical protein
MHLKGPIIIASVLVTLAIFVLISSSAFSQTYEENCPCLSEEKANIIFGEGNYQIDRAHPCGEEQSAINDSILPKYCINSSCPQGSFCLDQEDAKKVKYEPCSNRLTICGFDSANTPMYCFSPPYRCLPGCLCLTEQEARVYGFSDLCQNQSIECGHFKEVRYCFKVPKYACPTGCICLGQSEALAENLTKMCSDQAKKPILGEIVDAEKGLVKFCFKQSDMTGTALNRRLERP